MPLPHAVSAVNFLPVITDQRLRIRIKGLVQGVGFRPFVFRLANELGLTGWIRNDDLGVIVEAEGNRIKLAQFLLRIRSDKPPHSLIEEIDISRLERNGEKNFYISGTDTSGDNHTLVLPDIATCPDCLNELKDRSNRRYRYPFNNCTHCGPRYTIVKRMPYDRPFTTMHEFRMCPRCREEYEDPANRRFHAQPIACPVCGPQLNFFSLEDDRYAFGEDALQLAIEVIRTGRILALKGMGGFQLMVDARNDIAVYRLRKRKVREAKPFAIMVPDLHSAGELCTISRPEARLLSSPASPITLLKKNVSGFETVAPDNPELGIMLPYTPLHHLLMDELGFPVVATSGNRSDEPICIDGLEARVRLAGIADAVLDHNRQIARAVDDSVARVIIGKVQVLRRARGYAPLPITVGRQLPSMLSVGGHLKNTIAVTRGRCIFVSQHIGDLETREAHNGFLRTVKDFPKLVSSKPQQIICDLHPDYLTTHFAEDSELHVEKIQHHLAHVYACMMEHHLKPPLLGVSWDGTGYGDDGAIWGGEFFEIGTVRHTRKAHLRYFPLIGGDQAVREPRRAALGLIYEMTNGDLKEAEVTLLNSLFTSDELQRLVQALTSGVNTVNTSSIGRLFDAVSSLLGLCLYNEYEGQAAMRLEWMARQGSVSNSYPVRFLDMPPLTVDWIPLIQGILEDLKHSVPKANIALKLHHSLAKVICTVARKTGYETVLLTGGCFQNRLLTEMTVKLLTREGFRACWHEKIPPNDGGLAFGQIAAMIHRINSR